MTTRILLLSKIHLERKTCNSCKTIGCLVPNISINTMTTWFPMTLFPGEGLTFNNEFNLKDKSLPEVVAVLR